MNNLEKEKELAEFRKEIATLDPAVFDGHTCFRELTQEQRLNWLAELVVFVNETRRISIKHKAQKIFKSCLSSKLSRTHSNNLN